MKEKNNWRNLSEMERSTQRINDLLTVETIANNSMGTSQTWNKYANILLIKIL